MAGLTRLLERREVETQRSQTTARETEKSPNEEGDEEDDEEAHTEGVGQLQEEEPLIVTVEALTIPANFRHQYLVNSDTDTGRNSEAESNRSERSYVDVRPNTTYSRRSWPHEGNSSD